MRLLSNAWIAIAACALAASASAQTPFVDNFDSYALGSVINGQGGWQQWASAPNSTSIIEDNTTGFARSGRSVSINSVGGQTSDLVHQFSGFTTGQHTLRVYSYAPSGNVDKYFYLILNTYADLGPWIWSVDLELDVGCVRRLRLAARLCHVPLFGRNGRSLMAL